MWIQESKRRLFLDMHFPDWPDRQTATRFEPEKIARAFEEASIDSVILYAKCQFGNFYYDSKLGHKHRGLKEQDFFRETYGQLKSRGIQVIAYYSVAWDELYARRHPEWQIRRSDGSIGTDEFRWSTLCVNSPYREIVKSHLKEIAADLKPDGYWIDMTIIGRDACYCEHCRALFQKTSDLDLPVNQDPGNADFLRFVQFRYDYIQAFYEEIYSLIRNIQPEAAISNNYWGYPYSSHTMGSRAVGSLAQADYVTGEAYTDWTGLSAPGFFCRWLRCVGDGRPYEALISRFTGTWDYSVKPANQLAQEAYTVAANGGTVTIDDMPFADGALDWNLYREIAPVYREIKERQACLGGDALSVGAVFHSQISKDLYFHGEAPFISTITGAIRVMREMHLDFDFVFDENLSLERLLKYRFLLLPRVAILTDDHQEILIEYMNQGGLVIAAGELATQANPLLTRGGKGPLWEALGVEAKGMSAHEVSFLSDLTEDYASGMDSRPLTIRGPYVSYSGPGIEKMAAVTEPICITSGEVFFHNNLPAPYYPTDVPALWRKQIGKGYLLVFAQDVFAQFATYHQSDMKRLFQNILRYHKALPEVRFHCPSGVETASWEKDGKTILHLVNMVGGMGLCTGTMDNFEGRYQRTFEFIDELIPVHGVTVDIAATAMPVISKVLEAGSPPPEVKIEQTAEGYRLHIQKVERWVTLVIG